MKRSDSVRMSVSVAPQFVPEIKYAVRRTTFESAVEYAKQVLAESTRQGVRAVMDGIRERLYRPDA